jgi:hypothetical protein
MAIFFSSQDIQDVLRTKTVVSVVLSGQIENEYVSILGKY